MTGANIFVVYTAGNGNVTVSPRLGSGHVMPQFNSDAQVTLLEGSGVSNGKMVANVRCEYDQRDCTHDLIFSQAQAATAGRAVLPASQEIAVVGSMQPYSLEVHRILLRNLQTLISTTTTQHSNGTTTPMPKGVTVSIHL